MMDIKIGPMTYTATEMKNDHMIGQNSEGKAISLNGDIAYSELAIRINADNAPHVKLVCLWHEALHAILYQAGQRNHPEDLIEALAYGLVALVTDNPSLVEATRNPTTKQE